MQSLKEIILVSDGGADFKRGSFGWVLGTPDGHCLAPGSGAVFGYDPKSYRAEISGCRAGLLFLCHAFGYCEAQVHMVHLHVFCDNSGFVQKIGKFRSFPLGPESCCLDAEWDLLISVHGLLSLFPVPPTVEHVKGHQDRTQSYDSLDIVSQMNVDADSLATVELK